MILKRAIVDRILFYWILVFLFGCTHQSDDNPQSSEEIVHKQMEAMRHGGSDGIRMKEILKLGNQAVPELVQFLEDDNPKIRANAIILLGKIGDPRAINSIIKGLNDNSYDVRRRSINALDLIFTTTNYDLQNEEIKFLISYANGIDENSHLAIYIVGKVLDEKAIYKIEEIRSVALVQSNAKGGLSLIGKRKIDACRKELLRLGNSEYLQEFLDLVKSQKIDDRSKAIEIVEHVGKSLSREIIILLEDERDAIEGSHPVRRRDLRRSLSVRGTPARSFAGLRSSDRCWPHESAVATTVRAGRVRWSH